MVFFHVKFFVLFSFDFVEGLGTYVACRRTTLESPAIKKKLLSKVQGTRNGCKSVNEAIGKNCCHGIMIIRSAYCFSLNPRILNPHSLRFNDLFIGLIIITISCERTMSTSGMEKRRITWWHRIFSIWQLFFM